MHASLMSVFLCRYCRYCKNKLFQASYVVYKNVESKIELEMEFNLLHLLEPIIIVLIEHISFYLLPTGYFTSYNFYKEDGLITEA